MIGEIINDRYRLDAAGEAGRGARAVVDAVVALLAFAGLDHRVAAQFPGDVMEVGLVVVEQDQVAPMDEAAAVFAALIRRSSRNLTKSAHNLRPRGARAQGHTHNQMAICGPLAALGSASVEALETDENHSVAWRSNSSPLTFASYSEKSIAGAVAST